MIFPPCIMAQSKNSNRIIKLLTLHIFGFKNLFSLYLLKENMYVVDSQLPAFTCEGLKIDIEVQCVCFLQRSSQEKTSLSASQYVLPSTLCSGIDFLFLSSFLNLQLPSCSGTYAPRYSAIDSGVPCNWGVQK